MTLNSTYQKRQIFLFKKKVVKSLTYGAYIVRARSPIVLDAVLDFITNIINCN